MDHVPPGRDAVNQDVDAPLSRDPFARQLGDEWQPDEPGIYRFVGPMSGSESGLDEGAFELHARQKPSLGS